MKFNSFAVQTLAWMGFVACAHNAVSQQVSLQTETTATKWLEVSDCLLAVEHTVTVSAQEAGILQTVEVKLNDAVVSDQLLAKLDSRHLELEHESRQSEYAYAYKLANDDSEIEFQENLVGSAQLDLSKVEALQTRNSVTESELKQKQLALEAAEISLQRAKLAKDRAIVGAKCKFDEVKKAELKLQHAFVKAPLSGVASEILQHAGEWVQVGQPLFTIADPEHLVVHAHVPIDQINRTQLVDSAVQVESTTDDGAPIHLTGTVTSYDPRVVSNGLIRIHAQVLNVKSAGHWQILPGKQVTLRLALPTTTESFKVPSSQTAAR